MGKRRLMLIIISIFFISCVPVMRSMYPGPEAEKLLVIYPRFRIDNKINKICIIGNGPGASDISAALTDMITTDITNIKIVEPGNLQSILGGKIIEYGTGLTSEQSQALAQLLQVDHLILFEENIAPHRDYMYGGRAYNKINLKIVNTLTGEIIFQTSSNYGFIYNDPRQYGYSHLEELSTSDLDALNALRKINFAKIAFQLRYAFGQTKIGIIPGDKFGQLIVQEVMVDSPAYRAGIQKDDRVVAINDVRLNQISGYDKYLRELKLKQGDVLMFKIERGGKIFELEVKVPVIPFSSEEPEEKGKTIKTVPAI